MLYAIEKATGYIHLKDRKIIFEIDARAEKALFCKNNPQKRLGFTFNKIVQINENGKAEYIFNIAQGDGELFLGNKSAGEELLFAYAVSDSGEPLKIDAKLKRTDNNHVKVYAEDIKYAGKNILFSVCSYLDFPDLTCSEFFKFFDSLFIKYKNLKLDGVAIDEMGYPWHPDFNFNPSTYMVWNNGQIYGRDFEQKYNSYYNSDYKKDLFYILTAGNNDKRKISAINRYYEFLRKTVSDIEQYFYAQGKKYFGKDCFIGVHPTWYAIEEVDNTPEVWKNGIDWFEATRDYGFTDEIMIYPVRLALAHRFNSNIFYNMWYGEATDDIKTFYAEIWKNARYGGRTISLGYECINEKGQVIELKTPGYLESISKIEERLKLLDNFQKSAAKSDILIITGIESSCNVIKNIKSNGCWDGLQSIFKNSFILARDIFNMGYNCDYTLSYEIYNKKLIINKNGYLQYGSQEYKFVILFELQYSKIEILNFIEKVKASKTGCIIIGKTDTDFNGEKLDIKCDFNKRIESYDLLPYFEKYNAQKNRLPNGCILQDNSIIFTASYPNAPTGNIFQAEFEHNGKKYQLKAEDFACVKLENEPVVISPNLIELKLI